MDNGGRPDVSQSQNNAQAGELPEDNLSAEPTGFATQSEAVDAANLSSDSTGLVVTQADTVVNLSDDPAGSVLARLEAANQALAEAETVPEVTRIVKGAEVLRVYIKQADLGLEAQNRAATLKLRAQRKVGELLAEMDKNEGGNPNLSNDSTGSPPTLSELEITRDNSSLWQKIASLPEGALSQWLHETDEKGREITTAGFIRSMGFKSRPKGGEKPPSNDGWWALEVILDKLAGKQHPKGQEVAALADRYNRLDDLTALLNLIDERACNGE